MAEIRSIRGGSAKLNEEDRLELGKLLLKAGYKVQVTHKAVPGDTKNRKEYVVEFEE